MKKIKFKTSIILLLMLGIVTLSNFQSKDCEVNLVKVINLTKIDLTNQRLSQLFIEYYWIDEKQNRQIPATTRVNGVRYFKKVKPEERQYFEVGKGNIIE